MKGGRQHSMSRPERMYVNKRLPALSRPPRHAEQLPSTAALRPVSQLCGALDGLRAELLLQHALHA